MTMQHEHWLLPEGIDEVLPPRAAMLEHLRRDLLDLYHGWGYELVFPPFIEYVESLLSSVGSDLDLQTFKLTDQMNGRTLGIRTDITPQAARIDAHQLRREAPTRLCYMGTVLHTRPGDLSGSRAPLQIGAELYGHSGVESDLEILTLMMETLSRSGIEDLYLDLGHVGIFRGLARQAGLDHSTELALFDALQRKSLPEMEALMVDSTIPEEEVRLFTALVELSGTDVLERAGELLKDADEEVQKALTDLERLSILLSERIPDLSVHFDLAELRGYHYHTGVVFAAFVPGQGHEIARGGRYDDIGKVFGRARPACGFSADLKKLLRLGGRRPEPSEESVFAPWSEDPELAKKVDRLRAEGERVISGFSDQSGYAYEMGCRKVLEKVGDAWVLAML